MFATGEDPAFPDDAVEVGRVVGAWGIQGGVRVKPYAAEPQALWASRRWFLQPPAPPASPAPGASRAGAAAKRPAARARAGVPSADPPTWPRLLRIVQAREHGEYIVATVHGLEDRDAAQALAGARVFVSRSSFPTPDADEFYWVDLIGLAVRNREGTHLGVVVGLLETGPTCVLRVQPPAARDTLGGDPVEGAGRAAGLHVKGRDEERLIPFVSAYVDRVDLAGRCLLVDWPADD